MTIIAAQKGKDGTFMVGDSLAADANDAIYVAVPKVFTVNGFTIGYCGSYRYGQVMASCFYPPSHNPILDDITYMSSVFVEEMRETLESYGVLQNDSGVDSVGGEGSLLIIYREEIYIIQEDLSVIKVATPYAAIGAGMQYATGALHALQEGDLCSEDRLRKAVDAAICFCPRCGGSITILKHDSTTEETFVKPRIRKSKKDAMVFTETSPVSKKVVRR